MQGAVAAKRKPWQKNCTVLLDHSVSAPTVSGSERLTKCRYWWKRTSVRTWQTPLYRHKAAACAMHCHENGALCALNTYLQHRTDKKDLFMPFCLFYLQAVIATYFDGGNNANYQFFGGGGFYYGTTLNPRLNFFNFFSLPPRRLWLEIYLLFDLIFR